MKKVKVVEIIPHFDWKKGKELAPTEYIESVEELTKSKVFGKNHFKIKVKPSVFGDSITVYGVNCGVTEPNEDGGIDLSGKEDPVKIKRGEKKTIAFKAFDISQRFEVEYLDE